MLRNVLIAIVLFSASAPFMSCGSGSTPPPPPPAAKTWGTPVMFSDLHEGFQNGRLLVDATGRAVIAWSKDGHVWAATGDGENWGAPQQVDDAALRASLTDVAMNADGRVALVWHAEEVDPADHFKARLYAPASGWAASSQFLDALTSDGTGGAVDINASGDVMAVFARYDASGHVWARGRPDGSGWTPAATRLDTMPNYSNYPDVAVDMLGNATVVWEQWDGVRNWALTRSYSMATGWDADVTELDPGDPPSADRVRVALNASGDGLAYWTVSDYDMVRVRRILSGVWQAPETVATGTGIYRCQALVAPDGRIVLTWETHTDLYARVCVGGVWDTEPFWVSDDSEVVNLRTAELAMDRLNGRCLVMWTRLAVDDADGSAVWARWYDPTAGWSAAIDEVVPWTPAVLFDVDSVALLDDGRALAVLAGEDATVYEYSTYVVGYR